MAYSIHFNNRIADYNCQYVPENLLHKILNKFHIIK
jgi:hypothetical protein